MSALAEAVEPVVEFSDQVQALFEPHRYKVLYGGRGGVKSWSVARALLVLGAKSRLRILCTREVQNSIKESVHRLLSDQIKLLGFEDFYTILEHEIRGLNGTMFTFVGLSTQTIQSIKSYEGIDIVWVEEAVNVTKNSWSILIPTIRKEGSEIWITFNPELDTDETYVRFVLTPPPDAVVKFLTYRENPWFPRTLELERQHCKITDPDGYQNIWEGECRKTVAGAIYAQEVLAMVKSGRICNLPYDPRLKVHTIWDLGWDDYMAVTCVQRGLSEVRIIDYMEEQYKTYDWMAAELQKKNYNWGWDWLPHDGFSGSPQTGKTAYDLLVAHGRRVKPKVGTMFPVPNLPVEIGIKATRILFPRIYIDQTKCARLVECWKRYKRHVDKNGVTGEPIHDQYSHGCDDTRYLSLVVDKLTNEEEHDRYPVVKPYVPFDAGTGLL